MSTKEFHWITLATALVAVLGAASSLTVQHSAPGAGTMAGPAAAAQTTLKS